MRTGSHNKKRNTIFWISIISILICILITFFPYFKKVFQQLQNTKPVEIVEVDWTNIPDYSGLSCVKINNNKPFFEVDSLNNESFEDYWSLDKLGRCTGAVACLGYDLMPTEERGSISEIKPSGWQSIEYDFVEQKNLYNRCHLIGFQLAGENANECNLITGTRYMNVDGMLPFENSVAQYIRETHNHVYYMVRPIYENNELVARGILIEAYSIEDDGKGICFNVFCYNVQPGVMINYLDGSSYADGSVTVENKEESNSSWYNEEAAKNSASELYDENGNDYVLNTRRMKIHRPDCNSVSDMSPKNTYEIKAYLQVLIDAGYSPCQNCKPE